MTDSTWKWRAIHDEFFNTGNAAVAQQALTQLRDAAVVDAFQSALRRVFPEGVAILAAGAYGRAQIFPYSELDLVLLCDSTQRSELLKDRLPEFVRLLWNAGLRPNSVAATVPECLEAVERAGVLALSLFNRRLLDGDRALYEQVGAKLPAAVNAHRDKLRQQLSQMVQTRHSTHGDTPFCAQPDVKEGPGGSQDSRAADLLGSLKGEKSERSAEFLHAVATISTVRAFLHYRAGADQNVFDFEAQASFAQQKFAVSIREYFRAARVIHNEIRWAMDESERSEGSLLENLLEYRSRLSSQEFNVSRERLLLRHPDQLSANPALVLRLLEFIGLQGVKPSAETERKLASVCPAFAAWCSEQRPVWASLKNVLQSPHAGLALRTLQSTGLIAALVPEWKAVEGVVVAHSEYRYTLDERTLRTLEAIFQLRAGADQQRFAGLLAEIDDIAPLIFALLFQEMGGDALELAHAAGSRMEIPAETLQTIESLVYRRSDLSDAMSSRDLDDPATIRHLATRVGTIEGLRLLTVGSYAKIASSSAPEKLAWRLEQLWRAYSATQRELLRELETDRIEQLPQGLPANAGFVKGFPQRYLRAHSPAEIESHIELFEQSRPTGVAVQIEPSDGVYRITIVARDKPSLFASFAGGIASFGLDILKAEAFSNSASVVLDTFVVADPKRILQLNPTEADRLRDLLQRMAMGRTDAQKLMRGRVLPEAHRRGDPPHVHFDSEACPSATLVEVDAEDRPGLLYSLATVFSTSACNIDVVLVDTKGHRAIDVFYVAHEGRKLPEELQERLREKLLAAC